MVRYINTKTGAVIDSSFLIKGENWIEESALNKNEKEENHEKKEMAPDDGFEEVDLSKFKKPELIAFAKEHGIEIDEKSKVSVITEAIANFFE